MLNIAYKKKRKKKKTKKHFFNFRAVHFLAPPMNGREGILNTHLTRFFFSGVCVCVKVRNVQDAKSRFAYYGCNNKKTKFYYNKSQVHLPLNEYNF